MPIIGEVISAKSWKEVPIQVLLFITAAIAIGKVGAVTGMNSWIAQKLLPSAVPSNYFLLALFITTVSIVIHMFLGSVIAVMGVAIPALLAFTPTIGNKFPGNHPLGFHIDFRTLPASLSTSEHIGGTGGGKMACTPKRKRCDWAFPSHWPYISLPV